MRGKTVIVLVFLGAGCGGMDEAPSGETGGTGGQATGGSGGTATTGTHNLDITQSGTRLKMRVGTTPDGAKMFLGWRDTQRNEDCAFWTASDGQRRCFPTGAWMVDIAHQGPTFFTDNRCTTQATGMVAPANVVTACGQTTGIPQAPPYAWGPDAQTALKCGLKLYTVGAQIPLYYMQAQTCTAAPIGDTFYSVGAEIPASSLVGLTEDIE